MLEKEALRASQTDRAVSDAEAQLADRLDRLSAPLAENVLARAIELHQEDQLSEDTSVSLAELSDLALELGINPALIQRALLDELDTEKVPEESLFQKLFGPSRIAGGIVAEADREMVADKINEWMNEVEGMFPVSGSGQTTTFEAVRPGGRLASALASTLSNPSVKVRQTELVSGDQLIEFDVDSNGIQFGALMLLALGLLAGTGAGFGVAANETFANVFVRFMIPFGIGSTVGLGTAVLSAKYYTSKIKGTINRALDGIVHLTTFKRRKKSTPHNHGENPGWSDIVDEIYE